MLMLLQLRIIIDIYLGKIITQVNNIPTSDIKNNSAFIEVEENIVSHY